MGIFLFTDTSLHVPTTTTAQPTGTVTSLPTTTSPSTTDGGMQYLTFYITDILHKICNNNYVSCLDICQLPANPGPCRAAIPSFFFNSMSGRCEMFTYGGCDGNQNIFETEEACQNLCNPNG